MLGVIIGTRKRSNIPYIEVNFIAVNSSKHYIYAADPS